METIKQIFKVLITIGQLLTALFLLCLFTIVEAVPILGAALIIYGFYLSPVRTILVILITIPIMQTPGMTFTDWFMPFFVFWVVIVGTTQFVVPIRTERS